MRLTDHLEQDSVFTCGEKTFIKCYLKLSQLEDLMDKYNFSSVEQMDEYIRLCNEYLSSHGAIEHELGIQLTTLFKALKNGIYYKHEWNNKIEYHNVRGIELQGLGVIDNLCSYGECDFIAYYEEYGKTWALTKEELE